MKKESPFKLKSTKKIYKNSWINVREDVVDRPGGKEGIFGVVSVGYGVKVVALSNRKTVYLAKEYKYGHGKYTLEGIGGAIDEGEMALEAAKRELKEEIGGISNKWTALGYTISLPTMVDFKEYIFLAEEVEIVSAQKTDEGEVIEIVELPLFEAFQKVATGEISHDITCAALFRTYLLLNQ